MSRIDVLINCPEGRNELPADDVRSAECLVEELSGLALLPLFETVWIDDVTITFPAQRGKPVSIALRAQGFEPLYQVENMDCLVEERVTGALAELFDTLSVERCALI